MSNKPLFAIILAFFLCSCQQTTTINIPEISFSISSPKDGWAYFDDTKIMLAVNVDTEAVEWASDTCGKLGAGNHLTVFLPEGAHRISAEIQGITRERQITVSRRGSGHWRSRKILVNYTPLEFKTDAGTNYPFVYTQDGSIQNFRVAGGATGAVRSLYVPKRLAAVEENQCPQRDMRLTMPQAGGILAAGRNGRASHRSGSSIATAAPPIGTKRSFFVVNTINQMGTPHEVEAVLRYQSSGIAVWVAENKGMTAETLDELVRKTEAQIIPRVFALWGKPADIDGDGRFALLFSSTLNEEKAAIGFFNPADFFKWDIDSKSPNYNPASNEMDLLYIAMPEDASGSSYSPESIAATIAHELTHACTFTAKTWGRVKNGNKQAAREELFLDEGWSHLTENLCGYGVSGGNVKFLNRFFSDTAMYSFCGKNRLGQDDSAGMRGAMTLFLSWLFWKAGGMGWDSSDPVTLLDQGGISFLQRMENSPQTGWESIGAAFGKQTGVLFNEMLEEINGYRASGATHQFAKDPLTGEAVDCFVNMGEVGSPQNGGGVFVGFPKTAEAIPANTLSPWSFVLLESFAAPDETALTIHSQNYSGTVYMAVSGGGW